VENNVDRAGRYSDDSRAAAFVSVSSNAGSDAKNLRLERSSVRYLAVAWAIWQSAASPDMAAERESGFSRPGLGEFSPSGRYLLQSQMFYTKFDQCRFFRMRERNLCKSYLSDMEYQRML